MFVNIKKSKKRWQKKGSKVRTNNSHYRNSKKVWAVGKRKNDIFIIRVKEAAEIEIFKKYVQTKRFSLNKPIYNNNNNNLN